MTVIKNKFFLKTLPIMFLASLLALQNNANGAPRTAIRGTAASATRKPIASTTTATGTTAPAAPKVEPAVVSEPVAEKILEIIRNKSNQFEDALLSCKSTSSSSDDNELLKRIREQRAALENKENIEATAQQNKKNTKLLFNACDAGLRKCMMDDKVCGKDFTKCATDGDTDFGNKLNKCRRDINCTGEEFKLFTTEIKADRDMNMELKSYNAVIDCGNEYMNCIANECGMTFNKCLGKTAADKAINTCKSLATKCKEQDSGLASRFGTVIGKLRETAEIEVKQDEERMYKLRDLMKSACERMGAMFDERSFDCVYTVKFFAGKNQENPMASRKAYAGDMFTCNQEFFGIDVTTFKENAYRETRAQTGASSAFLGAGVGTAAGLIASGAMDRAIERQKAEKKVKAAKKEQEKQADANKKDSEDEEKKEDDGETKTETCKQFMDNAMQYWCPSSTGKIQCRATRPDDCSSGFGCKCETETSKDCNGIECTTPKKCYEGGGDIQECIKITE